MIELKCSKCNKIETFGSDGEAFHEGWIMENQKWVCQDCSTLNDKDAYFDTEDKEEIGFEGFDPSFKGGIFGNP